MANKRITLTIHTCQKFSDIWDLTIKLLEQNWGDRNMRTLLVTDSITGKYYDNVEVLSTGSKLNLPMRLKKIIDQINTEYIFFTLDDYFIVNKIDTKRIEVILDIMDKYGIDYLSFKNNHSVCKVLDQSEKIYQLDLNSQEDYIVNLYPGIWRKDFMKKTVCQEMDIWSYEVSLTSIAKKNHAICCVSKGNQFEIMDGIRKGKFLHRSYRYLKKNRLYAGNRDVIHYRTELKLFVMDKLKNILPKKITDFMKKILRKVGVKFYS